ncbi:MAG: NF038122 family metalloprotease [Phycisphaerales bacterium]
MSGPSSVEITMNSGTAWDYNPVDGVGAAGFDFEATLTHEMLHTLGFSSWISNATDLPLDPDNYPFMSVLDILRFDPIDTGTSVSFGELRGSRKPILPTNEAVMMLEANSSLWTPQMSTDAGPIGDGFQASHWQDDTIGGFSIGIMDPAAAPGLDPWAPEYLSEADIRALDLIGWDIDKSDVLDDLRPPAQPDLTMPPDGTAITSLTPTLGWSTSSPDVDVYVFELAAGGAPRLLSQGDLVFESIDYVGSSITLPAGVLEEGKAYEWFVARVTDVSWRQSDHWTFTTPAPCPADCDGNGVVNLDDLDCFVAAFLAGGPEADCDGNGIINLDDLDCFVAVYLAGCP